MLPCGSREVWSRQVKNLGLAIKTTLCIRIEICDTRPRMPFLPRGLRHAVQQYSKRKATPVSLREMVALTRRPDPSVLFNSSLFLAEELPIRLSHRINELEHLPHNLEKHPSVRKVINWYTQSFADLLEFSYRVLLQTSHNPG